MNINHSDSTIMLQLTAYLDGELEGQEISEVEERLATDDQYRGIMQKLQRTWDVLDILPTSQANASFTQSTMKLVVNDARNLTSQKKRNFWIWPLRILALLLVPAAASAGAYLASHYIQDQPNRDLERDLEQIRDFDIYNKDKNASIDFLEKLATETSLLGANIGDEMVQEERFETFSNPPTSLAALRPLSNKAKNRLRINRANFQRADIEDKNRVASFIKRINAHKDAENLKLALYRYYFWLKSIPETEEAELLDLKDTDQRIDKIESIVQGQVFDNFALQLPKTDYSIIRLMLLDTIQHRQEKIQKVYKQIYFQNPELLKRAFEIEAEIADKEKKLSETDFITFKNGFLLSELQKEFPETIDDIITANVILRIKMQLSLEAKQKFEWALQLQNPDQSEANLITSWLLAAFDARFNPVTPKNLIELFDELPSIDQDRLNNELPADREQILRKMHRDQNTT